VSTLTLLCCRLLSAALGTVPVQVQERMDTLPAHVRFTEEQDRHMRLLVAERLDMKLPSPRLLKSVRHKAIPSGGGEGGPATSGRKFVKRGYSATEPGERRYVGVHYDPDTRGYYPSLSSQTFVPG
jgi:hypothetical protein